MVGLTFQNWFFSILTGSQDRAKGIQRGAPGTGELCVYPKKRAGWNNLEAPFFEEFNMKYL